VRQRHHSRRGVYEEAGKRPQTPTREVSQSRKHEAGKGNVEPSDNHGPERTRARPGEKGGEAEKGDGKDASRAAEDGRKSGPKER